MPRPTVCWWRSTIPISRGPVTGRDSSASCSGARWRRRASTAREPIPLFEALLEEFPDARFNIDCKADDAVDGLIAALRRLECLDRVCIGSFSDRRLRRLRAEFGDALCTSFGPRQIVALKYAGRVPWGGQIAQVPVSTGRITIVTESTVGRAHRLGLHVHVWTIDEPDEMRRLLDLGVDGLMTDRPQVLKDVLVDRGCWYEN